MAPEMPADRVDGLTEHCGRHRSTLPVMQAQIRACQQFFDSVQDFHDQHLVKIEKNIVSIMILSIEKIRRATSKPLLAVHRRHDAIRPAWRRVAGGGMAPAVTKALGMAFLARAERPRVGQAPFTFQGGSGPTNHRGRPMGRPKRSICRPVTGWRPWQETVGVLPVFAYPTHDRPWRFSTFREPGLEIRAVTLILAMSILILSMKHLIH